MHTIHPAYFRGQLIGAGAVIVAIATLAAGARGQCPEIARLVPSTAAVSDNSGRAVAIDKDLIVIGAEFDDESPLFDSGAAYVYRFNGAAWVEEFKFLAGDATSSSAFGHSVAVRNDAVKGDRVVVGAHKTDGVGTDSGSVYVYKLVGGTWVLDKKLTASDAASGDNFGADVAIDGDTILVGAPARDQSAIDNGAVYVYREGLFGWLEEAKITANDAKQSDQFGGSVALSGNVALIGSKTNDVSPMTDSGAAYVYNRSGAAWTFGAKLFPAVGANFDNFGADLSLRGDVAVIGAPNSENGTATDSGAAYVFRSISGAWTEGPRLTAPSPVTSDHFGASVATTGTVAMIGAPDRDAAGTNSGLAYSFVSKNGVWKLDATHQVTGPASSDSSAVSVAISGARAVVGVPGDDDKGTDSGSAGVFVVGEFVLTALPSAVMAGDTLTFTASCGPSGTPVLLATTQANTTSVFIPIIQFVFSASEQLVLPATVPAGIGGGFSFGFTAYKQDAFGQVKPSNQATVQFN